MVVNHFLGGTLLHYGKDNMNAGYHMPNENYHMKDGHHPMMDICKSRVGQNCEVEMSNGRVYQGKIHSYDNENMYLVMQTQDREERAFGFGGGFGFPFFAGPFFPGFGLFGFPFFGIRRFRRFWW
jgi:hypothetical protein